MKTKIISFLYRYALRPVLFLFESDFIHQRFLELGHVFGRHAIFRGLTRAVFHYENPILEQEIAGIKYKNPVGLAAGFDKDADLVQILPEVGFGSMQVGTVTFNPYKGNPQPWTTRLKKSKALTVYFGLKNKGVEVISKKIANYSKNNDFPVSISVGKTNAKYTADENAGVEDYYNCLKFLVEKDAGDQYEINISCPNTFGGEPYTDPETLENLLSRVSELGTSKPIYLKMPINLPWDEFKSLCEVAIRYDITGVVIGNLNKDREDPTIVDPIPEEIKGGISGKPTQQLSNRLIAQTYREFGDKLVIVGVGGIFNAADAYEKIKFGASMIQLITGMIYEGPQLIGNLNEELVDLLKTDGYNNLSEAIGQKT